ncbi:MCE family protein [Lapillicoccus jejuensis]|uniref:Phospholipid/cholesterol/gamma-HCH transport system substrate-binding protein n=1 Tax=Lapillicoccus jejuensis TaxID=402171 RepID=A0A542DWI7_9MICO|nr:MCE family protein [Lapillicoccus jejuensis]TQJ07436.1 phospholipid/cholesterol/gamma-HCH transport system substrate-binding protein [Lapillicoccus jejuensis]
MRSITGPLLKSIAFVVVTVLATGVLAVVIANGSSGGGSSYVALFSDATSLNVGDDVRMAGVRIGTVTDVTIQDHRTARVGLSVEPDVRLARTVRAILRYRNLVGQRYVALDQGSGSPADALPVGSTIGLDRTQPALDLTVLFNGFQPLFTALSPQDVNSLSYEIIQVFQGEGGSVQTLVSQTATFTQTLASKDQVIGQVIDNLNTVLTTVNARSEQLSAMLVTLQQLTSGLAADRAQIGSAISSIGSLTTSVGGLVQDSRAPLRSSIDGLGAVSGTLSTTPQLDQFLGTLPVKLDALGRTTSYGSWMNFYLCSVTGRIPVPQGYYGGVGAKPVEARCRG